MDVSIAEGRHYVFHENLQFEEDHSHEFKGHRNFSVEELPPWSFLKNVGGEALRRSRRAISRTLCGFINSGHGGTVFLGITDEGSAKGMRLNLYQRDHVIVALKDLFSRFSPPVPESLVQMTFVPVLAQGESLKAWLNQLCKSDGTLDGESATRSKAHMLRTYEYCWCDVEAEASYECREWLPTFVIELAIKKQKVDPEVVIPAAESWPELKAVRAAAIRPVYEDEEGKCYCRGQGGLFQYSPQEVWSTTRLLVSSHYLPIIKRMRSQLVQARLTLSQAEKPMTEEEFRKKVLKCADVFGSS